MLNEGPSKKQPEWTVVSSTGAKHVNEKEDGSFKEVKSYTVKDNNGNEQVEKLDERYEQTYQKPDERYGQPERDGDGYARYGQPDGQYDKYQRGADAWERRRRNPYDCLAFEFQPENVAPYHEDSRLFVRPQWPLCSWWHFVLYRVVVAICITVWVVIDFLEEAYHFYSDNYGIWFVFATNWSFLLLSVSAVVRAVAAAVSFTRSRRYDPNDEEDPKPTGIGMMALWIIYNMAANGALVVTFSYWTFLAAFDNAGFLTTYMSQLKHSLNSAYILTDLMISATPIRIFHLVYPMFVGAVYTVFNALYFINNGVGPDGKPYAYYVMDWRHPIEASVSCSLGFITTTVMQVVLYGLYRLRLILYARVLANDNAGRSQRQPEELEPALDDPELAKAEAIGILTQKEDGTPQHTSYNSLEQMEMTETQIP